MIELNETNVSQFVNDYKIALFNKYQGELTSPEGFWPTGSHKSIVTISRLDPETEHRRVFKTKIFSTIKPLDNGKPPYTVEQIMLELYKSYSMKNHSFEKFCEELHLDPKEKGIKPLYREMNNINERLENWFPAEDPSEKEMDHINNPFQLEFETV